PGRTTTPAPILRILSRRSRRRRIPMLSTLIALMVLAAMAVAAVVLVYSLLPVRWRRSPLKGFRSLGGDIRLSVGRWDLADVERQVVRRVEAGAQVSLTT